MYLNLPALWIWKETCVDDLWASVDIDIIKLKNGRACSDDFNHMGLDLNVCEMSSPGLGLDGILSWPFYLYFL